MAAYMWKEGSRFKTDPQIAGEMCENLANQSRLTPENLLDENRPEDAPLHNEFDWNDESAAEKYRIVQAGRIIRSIVIKREETEQPVRQFLPIKIENSKKKYYPIDLIVQKEDMRQQMLMNALKEFEAFKRKYSTLREFAKVFEQFEELDQVSLLDA